MLEVFTVCGNTLNLNNFHFYRRFFTKNYQLAKKSSLLQLKFLLSLIYHLKAKSQEEKIYLS